VLGEKLDLGLVLGLVGQLVLGMVEQWEEVRALE
jgi:hypothetical protein